MPFSPTLCYLQKIMLEISTICLCLFFSYASISNQNPSKSTDSFIPIPGNLLTTAMAVMPQAYVSQALKLVLTLDVTFYVESI